VRDVLYLAGRYLVRRRAQSAVLIGSIALILFIPAGLHVLVSGAATMLTERAARTPLVLGARGSPVDLTLAALYFVEPQFSPIAYGEVEALRAQELGTVIPLHLRFSSGDHRIVGTTPEYLSFRALEVAEGQRFAVIGEAVLGARAAAALRAGPGESIVSTPAGAFDVAGSFPLRMTVVGVLAPAGTPDDDGIFVDLRTAWVIEGIGHGHEDVAELDPEAVDDGRLTETADGSIVAGPALLPYTEITPENLASFHFHGELADFPVDAAIIVPDDIRSEVVLRGRYLEGHLPVQLLVPRDVADGLVDTVFSVRQAFLVASAGLAAATAATATLVFALALRLRRAEIESMRRIGVTRQRLTGILATEILGILMAAGLLAGILTLTVSRFGGTLLRWLASG